MHSTPLPPPIVHKPRRALPVVLSVPHSGRDYPDWLVGQSRQGRPALETLEDPLVDRLVWRALGEGVGAVIACAPRAAVDCNRAEDETDPASFRGHRSGTVSARARGGLGIIPSRTAAHGQLWRRPVAREDLERRLADAYRPYHQAIEDQLGIVLDRHGCALLLDCHSMPPSRARPIVFGDRFGRSAAPWLTTAALEIAEKCGFSAACNDPFAGGHILDRHGRPDKGVHALQIEVDRRLYLDRAGEPSPGFDSVAALIQILARSLGKVLLDRRPAAAAE